MIQNQNYIHPPKPKQTTMIKYLLLLSSIRISSQQQEMSSVQALKNFTVTFVRHGQTKANAAKIIQSRSQGELSPVGIRMAESLGAYLTNENFTHAYTSDLKRCEDTMRNILKNIRNPPPNVTLDPTLRERDYGELENQPTQKILDIHAKVGGRKNAIPIPGSEPYEHVLNRTATFFTQLCERADNQEHANILVVTHSSWIGTLLDWLLTQQSFQLLNYDDEKRWEAPKNTATTKLIIHKKNAHTRTIQFIHIHDIKHLLAAGISP